MKTHNLQPLDRTNRIIFLGAVWDVLSTIGFITPWTAAFVLQQFTQLHTTLGLSGTALPVVEPIVMLFINFSGTVVLMWGGLRMYRPTLLSGAIDTAGRFFVALWMVMAIQSGATTLVGIYLLGEIVWFFLQGSAILRGLRAA